MRGFLCALSMLVLFGWVAFGENGNENAWYPDARIADIQLVELYTFHGLPLNAATGREIRILVNHGYAVGYCEELRAPLYAVYRYGNLQNSAEELAERSFERPPKFQVDLRTVARVRTSDCTGSGYDRGHMAPNYGLRTQYGHLAQIETFLMTNIVLQKASLNRYVWGQAEKRIANVLAQDDGDRGGDGIEDLWVVSGPIFEGEIVYWGEKKIAIPSAFFKVVIRQKSYYDSSAQAIAVYYPQEPAEGEEKERFVSVDFIEGLTGLDFSPNLEDKYEDKMEGKVRDWGWVEIED